MIRTDLRNGMVIEYRDGEKAIVKDDLFLDITDLSVDCNNMSDYDIFNDTDKMNDWEIVKVYDNIIDMNLLWERKNTSPKIKPLGYRFLDFELGQTVMFKGKKENIVGFDEDSFDYYIAITKADGNGDKSFLTSCLDIADTQKIYWVDKKELDIAEENDCVVEETPKAKIPKYVKIVKCSNDEFWYNNRIGKIYRVNDINSECGYETIDEEDGSKAGIKIKDCIPIKKKELFKVGNFVKIKKNIKYDYCIPPEDVSKLRPSLLTISEVDENTGDVMLAEDENFYWWKTSMLKPVLNK